MLSARAQAFCVDRLLGQKDGNSPCAWSRDDQKPVPQDEPTVKQHAAVPQLRLESQADCAPASDDTSPMDADVLRRCRRTCVDGGIRLICASGADAPAFRERELSCLNARTEPDDHRKAIGFPLISPPCCLGDETSGSLSDRKCSYSRQWCLRHNIGVVSYCPHPFVITSTSYGMKTDVCQAELCQADLWEAFHALGTEMIVTRAGRRMFPAIRLHFRGLEVDARYKIWLEFAQCGAHKYRYVYHSSKWAVAGKGEGDSSEPRVYMHPDCPFSGRTMMSQGVSFERVKLTNNVHPSPGQVSLTSMQKFQPRIYVEKLQKTPDSDISPVRFTFNFLQTSFIAVTAYQNQQITQLKIARNPFAKGFRESGKNRQGVLTELSVFQDQRTLHSNKAGEFQVIRPSTVSTHCLQGLQAASLFLRRPLYDSISSNAENGTELLLTSDGMHASKSPMVFQPGSWRNILTSSVW